MTRRDRLVLLGHPVSHSLSPVMHDAALAAAGIPLRYEALDVAPSELRATLSALRGSMSAGNITIPHKVRAMEWMDECSVLARRVGAVNTFWREQDGRLTGDNTDVEGFDGFVTGFIGTQPPSTRVAVIGAGGAAAAVLAALVEWPKATATVHSRNPESARKLCARFFDVAEPASMSDDRLSDADIVVNATPVGLAGDAHPVALDTLRPDAVVLDLVYRREETSWVREARARGHRASDGLPMLLHQGVAAFERWFGVRPDAAPMWRALTLAAGRA